MGVVPGCPGPGPQVIWAGDCVPGSENPETVDTRVLCRRKQPVWKDILLKSCSHRLGPVSTGAGLVEGRAGSRSQELPPHLGREAPFCAEVGSGSPRGWTAPASFPAPPFQHHCLLDYHPVLSAIFSWATILPGLTVAPNTTASQNTIFPGYYRLPDPTSPEHHLS